MSRTVTAHGPPAQGDGPASSTDWDALYPPDPELMASAEGDTKGLAELQRAARRRTDGSITHEQRGTAGKRSGRRGVGFFRGTGDQSGSGAPAG